MLVPLRVALPGASGLAAALSVFGPLQAAFSAASGLKATLVVTQTLAARLAAASGLSATLSLVRFATNAAVVNLPGGGFGQYGVGDSLTIRYTMPAALVGPVPSLSGALLTILLVAPDGSDVTLLALPGPTPGSMQAPYVPLLSGVYRGQGRIVYPSGAVTSGQPVGTFFVNPPLF